MLASLSSLTITPAAHDAADFAISFDGDGAGERHGLNRAVTGTHPVTITAVADQPTVQVGTGDFGTLETRRWR